jgi:hypothetical protein
MKKILPEYETLLNECADDCGLLDQGFSVNPKRVLIVRSERCLVVEPCDGHTVMRPVAATRTHDAVHEALDLCPLQNGMLQVKRRFAPS